MTRKRLRKWQNKIIFLQKSSDEALKDIADNELDFCYIDGDHSYKQVKKDIENYYRKVKEGGILGGHDIDCGHSNGEKGVTKAVIEFCVENDFELNILGSDWWIEVK